eukprot:2232282-Ditylum_brightwellii.AAC.1
MPITCPTCARFGTTSAFLETVASKTKATLISNNYGIGIEGGTQFVVFTLLAQWQKFVFRTRQQLKDGDLPTRWL